MDRRGKKQGAVALFGEKYDKIVENILPVITTLNSVVEHTLHPRTISFVKLFPKMVAAGVRRIEALTGRHALEYLNNKRNYWEVSRTTKNKYCRYNKENRTVKQ